ncbi:MAG: hypothetical protein ACI3ZY_13660 [Parabacteroides sp.]
MKDTGINRGDLLALASHYGIKGADSIIRNSVEIVAHYEDYAKQAGVGSDWIIIIKQEQSARMACMEVQTRKRGMRR